MTIRVSVLVLLSMGLAREESSPPLDDIHRVGHAAIYLLEQPPPRRLRGDWEPPGLLVMAHSDLWAMSAAAIIRAAGDETEIAIVTRSGDSITAISEWLAAEELLSPRVRFLDARLDSPWVRDFGPFEVVDSDGALTWLDPLYDTGRPVDDALPEVLGDKQRVRVEPVPFSIDGGAVVSNGAGVCVVTRSSAENAGLDLDSLRGAEALQMALGCRALTVVPALIGERTGHADIFVQFLGPDLAAVSRMDAAESVFNARFLDDTARAIQEAGRLTGQEIGIVRVHMPVSEDGETFYTYVNGVRLHGGFVVPSYAAVPAVDEQAAYADLDSALFNEPLLAVPADEMIQLSGAVHCIVLGLSNSLPSFREASRALR